MSHPAQPQDETLTPVPPTAPPPEPAPRRQPESPPEPTVDRSHPPTEYDSSTKKRRRRRHQSSTGAAASKPLPERSSLKRPAEGKSAPHPGDNGPEPVSQSSRTKRKSSSASAAAPEALPLTSIPVQAANPEKDAPRADLSRAVAERSPPRRARWDGALETSDLSKPNEAPRQDRKSSIANFTFSLLGAKKKAKNPKTAATRRSSAWSHMHEMTFTAALDQPSTRKSLNVDSVPWEVKRAAERTTLQEPRLHSLRGGDETKGRKPRSM
ncbi:uncharacterized protein LOC144162506 isoform X2 [Haemaphysalis longicornis]